jgi:class 3 adenylate cyclase/tetratricopeptide (TPR) repeat protein
MNRACGACAAEIADGAKFCAQCGAPAPVSTCPGCGAPAGDGRFCSQCGTALTPAVAAAEALPGRTAERRLTSVLFGDLVGFTTLSEARDPEEVRELLSRYFDQSRTVVQRYGGTVEKFIGDAVMAVWGVPVAHEDDAERAVRAGLDLAAMVTALGEDVGMTGLSLRVGVVTGEVAVTLGATGEGMVAGDAVNTAARVQTAAESGTVWVDDATRMLTSAAVTYTDTGEHALKGKAEPVRLFQARSVVAAVGGAQRVDGLEAPFTGRDRELRLVKELFHATVEDGRPRLVLVSGVAGMGKSRLGWEYEKYVDGLSGTVRWHRGRCLSYGEGVAFWALAEMVRGRLQLAEGDTEDAASLDARLTEWLPDEAERSWVVPRIAVLLGSESRVFPREDLFAAWTVFFERVTADRDALVMLVEDLQYADDGLLDFLEHALETARFPLFVLALARPDLAERRAGIGTGRRATTVHLEPLGDKPMAALVDGLVAGLPDEARSALVTRAEGVPLYAVETVRALIDRDAVVPFEGRYVLAADARARVDLVTLGAPASLQALVSSRLDSLDPKERSLVQNASVLGTSFSLEGLTSLGADDLDVLLPALVRKEIFQLQTDPRSPERGQYRFMQAVVRQVAYDTLSRRDRKARHLAVAHHLRGEPDPGHDLAAVVARHLLDAVALSSTDDGDLGEIATTARDLLAVAAQRALNLGSPAEALRHYAAGLSLPSDDVGASCLLHEGAAAAAIRLGDPATAHEHAEQALEGYASEGRREDEARAAALLGHVLVQEQNLSGAIALLSPWYDQLADDPANDRVVLLIAEQLGRAHDYSGEHEAALRYFQRMMTLAEAMEDMDRLVGALTSWATLWIVGGNPTAGLALLERAVKLAREVQLPSVLIRPLNNTAAFLGGRDLSSAIAAAEECLQLATQGGFAQVSGLAASNLSLGLWNAGRWEELRTRFAGDLARADPPMRAFLRRRLALATGSAPEDGDGDLTELGTSGESEDLQIRAWYLGAIAASLTAPADQARRAELAAQAARSCAALSGTDDDFVYHWTHAVEAAADIGDQRAVDDMLDIVRRQPPGLRSPLVRSEFLRLRATYAADAQTDPDGDLRQAIAGLGAFGAIFSRAQAEAVLAERLAGRGEHEKAASLLESARATFTELGATPWIARTEQVLSRV